MKYILSKIFRKTKISINGINLFLDLSNPHEKKYFNSIKNDDYFISKRLIKKGYRVLDLGANIGFTALLYLKFGASEVYAFEPVLELYKRIQSIKTDKIKAFNIALADYEGNSKIVLSSSHNQGHSLNKAWPNKFKDVFKNSLSQLVKVSTLDKTLSNDTFDFIKIDVEGMEVEVIKGGFGFFKRNFNSIVQIEIYDWQFNETHELLSNYYSKTYIPYLNVDNSIEFISLDAYKNIKDIEFKGPPNYIYSNINL